MPWTSSDHEPGEPWFDPETATMVIGHPDLEKQFRIDLMPMLYNDRIMVTRLDGYPTAGVAGFCFNKGIEAILAAVAWLHGWDEMDVPVGYKKIAFNDLPNYGKGERHARADD